MYCNVILRGLDFCQIFQKLLFTMNLNVSKDPRIWTLYEMCTSLVHEFTAKYLSISFGYSGLFFPCLWNLSPINAREITKNDNNKSRKKILIQCTIFRMLLNCVVYPPRIKLPQNKPQIISTPEQTDTGRQLSLQPSAFVTKQIQILVQIQKQIWIRMKIPIVQNKKNTK